MGRGTETCESRATTEVHRKVTVTVTPQKGQLVEPKTLFFIKQALRRAGFKSGIEHVIGDKASVTIEVEK